MESRILEIERRKRKESKITVSGHALELKIDEINVSNFRHYLQSREGSTHNFHIMNNAYELNFPNLFSVLIRK